MQMKRMLVLSELNQVSEISLEFAVDLAAHLRIKEVVVLNLLLSANQQAREISNVLNLAIPPYLQEKINIDVKEKHTTLVKKQAQEIAHENVEILPRVEYKNDNHCINHYMRKYEAGLLICGSQEKPAFLEISFGSAAKEMSGKIHYPMIILTDEPAKSEIKSIALAIDWNDKKQEGIDEVIAFSRKLNAYLQLIHVMETPADRHQALDAMQKLAKNKNLRNYSINLLDNQNLQDGLESFARKTGSDMIALLNPGNGKLHKMIFGEEISPSDSGTRLPIFICKSC